MLYRERSMDVLVAAGNGNSSDLWCDCSDIVQNSSYSYAKGWTDGNHQKGIFFRTLISIAVFAVSNMSYVNVNTPFTGRYSFEMGNIRTMVDVAGIAILYAHLIQCCELRVRKELEAVQNVLQNQYAQYKQSKESIELINYKYHDLKHQIAVLRSEADPGKREAFLDKMEADIKKYESQNKTGNKVLDTVLTTKSLYCAKHNITFTCVADGTLLDFMDVMDICSIFGNALDNAIECELKIPDKEKKINTRQCLKTEKLSASPV